MKTKKEIVRQEKEKFEIHLEEYGKTRVKLSVGLKQFKEKLQKEYLENPPTKIKVVDEENIFELK